MPRIDVSIAGELNLDLLLYGLPEQLVPERELLAEGMMLTLGSSSGIVAHNLAALGAKVGFSSRIGDDVLGKIALERLRAAGVDVSRVRKTRGASSGLTVILPHSKWRNILTYPGTIFDLRFEDLDLEHLASARHFHLCSMFLQRGLRPRVAELFREMKAAGLSTSLDTNDDPDDHWKGVSKVLKYVDVFLPNEREACKITRTDDVEKAVKLLADLVPTLVVKRGKRGAIARQAGKEFVRRGVAVNAIDPVGAGDSFDAGFIYQYVRGEDIETCLRYGNLAGAFSTTKPGGTEAFRDGKAMKEFFGSQKLSPQRTRRGNRA